MMGPQILESVVISQVWYKHILFTDLSNPARKTKTFKCGNHTGTDLGWVRWECRWRQYCFFPIGTTLYSKSCLDDISHFINQLMELRKKEQQT